MFERALLLGSVFECSACHFVAAGRGSNCSLIGFGSCQGRRGEDEATGTEREARQWQGLLFTLLAFDLIRSIQEQATAGW